VLTILDLLQRGFYFGFNLEYDIVVYSIY